MLKDKMTVMKNNRGFKNYLERYDEGGNIVGDPIFVWTPIRRQDNVIYFSAEVDEYAQMVLTQYLNDAQSDLLIDNARGYSNEEQCIKIIINSPGGYLHCGLALYDIIKNMSAKVPIECEVQGHCASAASLLLLAANRRSMTKNSTVLLHQLSTGIIGTYKEVSDTFKNSEQAMEMLREIYLSETLIGYTKEEISKIKLMESKEEYEKFAKNEEILQRRVYHLNELLDHDLELCKFDCERLGIVFQDRVIQLDEDEIAQINKLTEELVNKKMDKLLKEENGEEIVEEKKETKTKKSSSVKKKPITKKKNINKES